ncbi:hypothetical protein HPB48_023127 [Haemaphysalis longicornis]|uniref:Uncharacterized protein n=1 Tax=Haemaphysalis longicornis TaxID=44386 RepID=A0A9J6FAI2_HAELO|nr:hypothetical protein HPB48_023127 [Haemaphysalis longicornis]
MPSRHYTLSCEHVHSSACFADIAQSHPSYPKRRVEGKNLWLRKDLPKRQARSEVLSGQVTCCRRRENERNYAGPLDRMSRYLDNECAF